MSRNLTSSAAILGPPVQIAYAVTDVDVAADRWRESMAAGPFVVHHHIELASVDYRGRPGVFDHSSAYGQWGPVMVELVQVHGDGPDVVHDLFPSDGAPRVGGGATELGLHHLAFIVDDLDQATDHVCQTFAAPVAMTAATVNGTEFRFIDTSFALGHMIELYERTTRIVAWYEHIASLSR